MQVTEVWESCVQVRCLKIGWGHQGNERRQEGGPSAEPGSWSITGQMGRNQQQRPRRGQWRNRAQRVGATEAL